MIFHKIVCIKIEVWFRKEAEIDTLFHSVSEFLYLSNITANSVDTIME